MNSAPKTIRLSGGRGIGPGHPCFIVAEMGNNHQGDIAVAREMVRVAAGAGADAVKFQKRDMDSLLTRAGRAAPYTGPNSFGATYGAHRQALELDMTAMAGLKALAEGLGLVFFASAWDLPSARDMVGLGMELFKICSADLVNLPLVRFVGEQGLPAILSTGMSDWRDVDAAVAALRRHHDNIVLLHCNSSYPCPDELVGLPVLTELADRYGLPVGYSGHESGLGPSVASVALGACVVERHFTLDRSQRGTDHRASLEPDAFARLCSMIREVEGAMLQKEKRVCPSERASAAKLRKSLVFARDLPAGHILGPADIALKCPGTGISPVHWDDVLGARLTRSVAWEDMLDWDLLVLPSPADTPAAETAMAGRPRKGSPA